MVDFSLVLFAIILWIDFILNLLFIFYKFLLCAVLILSTWSLVIQSITRHGVERELEVCLKKKRGEQSQF